MKEPGTFPEVRQSGTVRSLAIAHNPAFLRSGNAPAAFASVEVTADHYNRYKSDLGYLKTLGANMYRFSFSWARIFPNCNGTVNEDAIKYYADMIDEIKARGAEPVGTVGLTVSV